MKYILISLLLISSLCANKDNQMTKLDKLLIKAQSDETKMKDFYQTFLTSYIYVPTYNIPKKDTSKIKSKMDKTFKAVIIKNNQKNILILFDTIDRLKDYATYDIGYVKMLGFALLDIMPENLYWALNHLNQYKEFSPDEINWLRTEFIKQSKIDYNTEMLIGKPKIVDNRLLEIFIKTCKHYSTIKSAYLGQIYLQEVSLQPFLTLIINTTGIDKNRAKAGFRVAI